MADSTQVVEYTTYIDTRTGEQRRNRRVLDDDFSTVRDREIALLRAAPHSSLRQSNSNSVSTSKDDMYALPRRTVRWKEGGDEYFSSDGNNNAAVVKRSSPAPPSRRSRRRDDRDRRARSAQPPPSAGVVSKRNFPDERNNSSGNDDSGVLWYSMRNRQEGNWVERNFDSSYDGLIAGVAGAAIGAIVTRRFAAGDFDEKEKSSRKWKILGGAVAGAAAFNSAENWYRVYTEEKEERREEREEEWREGGGRGGRG